jgi:hypothetical protein
LGSKDKPVNAEAYLEVFRNIVLALQAIEKEFSTLGTNKIQWEIIETGTHSPIFATIQGAVDGGLNKEYSENIIHAFVDGVEQLNHGRICPKYFNEQSLRHVAKIVSQSKLHLLRAKFFTGQHTTELRRVAAANAHWAKRSLDLEKKIYIEYGSIEGYLQKLNTTKTRKDDRLTITDTLTDHQTLAIPQNQERLEPELRKAWKHRVRLEGEITVDRQTKLPKKIVFDNIFVFPGCDQLPQIQDLRGIDITGGIEPSEYVRGLRDGE